MATDKQIAEALRARGFEPPQIKPENVESAIVSEHYFTASEGVIGASVRSSMLLDSVQSDPIGETTETGRLNTLELDLTIPAALQHVTFCTLILVNGTKIVGVNYGPVVSVLFDAKKGRELARADAIRQVYPLLGFSLRDQLVDLARSMDAPRSDADPAAEG